MRPIFPQAQDWLIVCGVSLACSVAMIRADPVVGMDTGSLTNAGKTVTDQVTTGGVQLAWSSVPNARYRVEAATNLAEGFFLIASNVPATPAMNQAVVGVISNPCVFYRVIQE